MLTVRGLRKHYGATVALDGVDLAIGTGEVLGLLGPNGAGKTTLVESIAGLVEPEAGAILVEGAPLTRAARARVGVALQADALQDAITPREALGLFARLYGSQPDVNDLLARFGLADRADARFTALSGGQKQRLSLALALINDPLLVLLDEPSRGLDPEMRQELHGLIRDRAARGRAVLLATHDMEEAEQLCDRIAVIDHGRVIVQGTPSELVGSVRAGSVVEGTTTLPLAAEALGHIEGLTIDGLAFRCRTDTATEVAAALLAHVERQGGDIVTLHVGPASLEDVILELTARKPPR